MFYRVVSPKTRHRQLGGHCPGRTLRSWSGSYIRKSCVLTDEMFTRFWIYFVYDTLNILSNNPYVITDFHHNISLPEGLCEKTPRESRKYFFQPLSDNSPNSVFWLNDSYYQWLMIENVTHSRFFSGDLLLKFIFSVCISFISITLNLISKKFHGKWCFGSRVVWIGLRPSVVASHHRSHIAADAWFQSSKPNCQVQGPSSSRSV